MRSHNVRRTAAVVALVFCSVAGCSGSPGDSEKEEKPSGPTYDQVLKAMTPDVVSALKATMPGIEMNENSSADDCGGPDVIDSKDSSKRIGSTVITIPGDPSDKRQAKTLVQEASDYLTSHGWAVEKQLNNPPAGHPDGIVVSLKKPGTAGGVDISAWPFKLTSGKISQTFGATIATDCLRNSIQDKDR